MGGVMFDKLPSIADATLPDLYVGAKAALEKCARIDECRDWPDRTAALGSYARQAEEDSLRKLATRIQARAIRRCGELLKQRQKEEDAKRKAEVSAESAQNVTAPMTADQWMRSVVSDAVADEIEQTLAALRGSA